MQACGGAAVTGSLQQPILAKASPFPPKGPNLNGFPRQLNLCSVKPLHSSFTQGSLVIARAASSVSPPITELECNGYSFIDDGLSEADPEFKSLELIASENFTSRAVMEALGPCLTNEYYGGNEYIDELEILCQIRTLAAFHLDTKKWGVNVQPLSGSPANFEAYTAILNPDDRLIDYDMLEKMATLFRPKLIIVGASAYPRDFDYPRFRKITDAVGAFLMMDMAHISGLVAASVVADLFEYCEFVTTTTHKSSCCRIDRLGYSLVLGGSDNHLVLVDLRPLGLDGDRVEKILDMASITLNKNSVPDDVSTLVPTLPGGIHIDSPAMTAQGFSKNEIEATAEFIHEGIQITLEANESAPG
ncbi:hypothetical protein CDL15_Pgr026602 [Punica granatum]|uniref:Serine hydroxymethyltransferase-like domain-containing protein n=1 Tax=Punica granatum TaxID=22663 RepID=A0A218WLP7_PUNGR|nr:hypothetical protein CDL15_Pgr026602 [Punica granatum]